MDVRELLAGLSHPSAFPRSGDAVEVVQTHVSVVFLTGDRVYKVKKSVVLWGLIDQTALSTRQRLCREEVRLNRRTAPDVYLGVEPVVRRGAALAVGGRGEVVDAAVVMRRIEKGAGLLERVEAGLADAAELEDFGRFVRAFHDRAERGERVARAGRPVAFARVLRRNSRALAAFPADVVPRGIAVHFARRFARLLRDRRAILAHRAREGRVVEGHGDLRLEHAVLEEGPEGPRWAVIDGIEFSEALRCLDPLSDALFLSMDLLAHGRPDLAAAYEAGWSAAGADPDAAALAPLWLSYRAQVRALVDAQRSVAPEVAEEARAAARRSAGRRLLLAWRLAREGPPPLVVLVGPSGVGKSVVARAVAPLLDAVVVQSDVVRKRLAGLEPTERAGGEALARLYAPGMSTRTYAACLEEAEAALRRGRAAVLDATFLRRSAREQAAALARRRGSPLSFLSIEAPEALVRERLERRVAADTDPSDAGPLVHASQRVEAEPFDEEEARVVARHDGSAPPDAAFLPLVDALCRSDGDLCRSDGTTSPAEG